MSGQFSTGRITRPTYQAPTTASRGRSLGPSKQDNIPSILEGASITPNDWTFRKPITADQDDSDSSSTDQPTNQAEQLDSELITRELSDGHAHTPAESILSTNNRLSQTLKPTYTKEQQEQISRAVRTIQAQDNENMTLAAVKVFYGAKDVAKTRLNS